MVKKLFCLATLFLFMAGCLPSRDYGLPMYPETLQREAAKKAPPLWQVPLGPALVEEMRLLPNDRLLVGLKKYDAKLTNLDLLLIDTGSGKIIWRFDRSDWPGVFTIIFQEKNTLFFEVKGKKGTSLLAVDDKTGRLVWTRQFAATTVWFAPLPSAAAIVAVETGDTAATISAIAAGSGDRQWERTYPLREAQQKVFSPLVGPEGIFSFYQGVEKLSPASGAAVWKRPETRLTTDPAPPQLDGKLLYAITADNQLLALDADSGSTVLSVPIPKQIIYTNMYPLNKRIYLRGVSETKPAELSGEKLKQKISADAREAVLAAMRGEALVKGDTYQLLAMDRASGGQLWSFSSNGPTVSNLLEDAGTLYAGTARALLAIDAKLGSLRYARSVTNTGRTYPVEVRKAGNKIVFITELVVAAYEPASGKQIYRHGITPVTDLNSLDAKIKAVEAKMSRQSAAGQKFRWASFHSSEASRYQNMARSSYSKAMAGDAMAGSDYGFAKRMEKDHTNYALQSAISEVGEALAAAFEKIADQAGLDYDQFLRRSILSAYGEASGEHHVYRPHVDDDNFLQLSLVHIPSGKRSNQTLSPSYQEFGLWNLVDLEKGVVYHHGLGLDAGKYEFSEPFFNVHMVNARWYQSFLIAQPLENK